MPIENNFQHDELSRKNPGDRLTTAELATSPSPDSPEWVDAMAQCGSKVSQAGVRLIMYKIKAAPEAASRLADIIVRQCDQLLPAVAGLEKHDSVLNYCVEINRLENEADQVARSAIGVLFDQETDPISLIKLKELYEVLETATDKAEDAANVLEGVVLKSA